MANASPLENTNVFPGHQVLPSPRQLKATRHPSSDAIHQIARSRAMVREVVSGRDPRLLVVVGPCSIHDPGAALDYARRLKALAKQLDDRLLIVMRVYFEKPRTTTGWKGLVNDPALDDSFDVARGLAVARELLIDIAELGLPAATEALDNTVPQYLGDLITWTAIGARTSESQSHREMASGLSTPVGFKNGTHGQLDVAINGIRAAASSHHFMGINEDGVMSVFHSKGNPDCHLILRGGREPNYDRASLVAAHAALVDAGVHPAIVVDCSHANALGNEERQLSVAEAVVGELIDGLPIVRGLMFESFIEAGRQDLQKPSALVYGRSITDPCLSWDDTEKALNTCWAAMAHRL